jgi:hypothetical protein
MVDLVLMQPADLDNANTEPLSNFRWRFLAEGDSWFSMGALNPLTSANLLQEMTLSTRCVAVNCALPGDTLRRMVDTRRDPQFVSLLAGARARDWDALLISAGGNDLIDALGAQGAGVPLAQRLLRRADEWGPAADGVARYLSADGWTTFSDYLKANFEALLALRDRSPSAGRPVFSHGYAVPTPRPSGAGLGSGPWLLPPLLAYAIPAADHPALARLLIEQLAALLASMAADQTRFPNLHFFDSTQLPIVPAAPGTSGESGDWANEIHLTHAGCRKVARPWGVAIDGVLGM